MRYFKEKTKKIKLDQKKLLTQLYQFICTPQTILLRAVNKLQVYV